MSGTAAGVRSESLSNVEAEKSVLGAILVDNGYHAQVADIVRADDFELECHRILFTTITRMLELGQAVDFVTLVDELRTSGLLQRVGDASYITSLTLDIPEIINVVHYARIVRERSSARQISDVVRRAEAAIRDGARPDQVADQAVSGLLSVAGASTGGSAFKSLSAIIDEYWPTPEAIWDLSVERPAVLPTGLCDLDEIVTMQAGNLVMLGARPGVGKTALALGIAAHAARTTGRISAFVSLEMTDVELAIRLLAGEANVNTRKVNQIRLDEDEKSRLAIAWANLRTIPVLIDETPSLTVTEIMARCRRLAVGGGLGLVIVDHLQLLSSDRRVENRNNELALMTKRLKEMAKSLGIPVMVLSQLNRGPEGRPDKRPKLSDLRESGAIEQDADIVLFLYREELTTPNQENHNLAELIVAKNRGGPCGGGVTIGLHFDHEIVKYSSLSTGPNRYDF